MKTLKAMFAVLPWIACLFGILLIIGAFSIIPSSPSGGVLYILAGLLCTPVARILGEKIIPNKNTEKIVSDDDDEDGGKPCNKVLLIVRIVLFFILVGIAKSIV